MGQVLEHCLAIPERGANEAPEEFMVTRFIEAVRTEFRKQGVLSEQGNRWPVPGRLRRSTVLSEQRFPCG